MSRVLYKTVVFRYVYDTVTQEFVNIGIAICAPEANYFKAQFNPHYSRISRFFRSIDGNFYRTVTRSIQNQVQQLQQRWQKGERLTEKQPDMDLLMTQVMPRDDSSLVYAILGGGLTEGLDGELTRLYQRYVTRYDKPEANESRTDEQIWKLYQQEFAKQQIIHKLESVTIRTANYEQEFTHAWKNERWHPVEAVSFDLEQPSSILRKANTWIGNSVVLSQSEEMGTLHLLLGAPRNPQLHDTYEKAVSNLRSNGQKVEVVEEDAAAEFSARFAAQIHEHDGQS
jgi:hypothetical protein